MRGIGIHLLSIRLERNQAYSGPIRSCAGWGSRRSHHSLVPGFAVIGSELNVSLLCNFSIISVAICGEECHFLGGDVYHSCASEPAKE
jgi:hypothetical protein